MRQPLPQPSELTAGFWENARQRRLVVQQCSGCGRRRHYPQYLCPQCRSSAWSWMPIDGSGTVHSFTVTHQSFGTGWATDAPYAIATIALLDDIRMLSDLPAADTDDVAIGLATEVFFEDHGDITLPRFRLCRPLRGRE